MNRRVVYGPRDGTVLSQQLQHRSDDIPKGEATITLEDVQINWALPIDGLPITGLDIERSTEEWQIYCREYLGFSPDEKAFKGSRLHTHAIMNFIRTVEITHDTPRPTVVQYTRCIAMLLLGGLMCPDSSGNMVPLLYLSKLEEINAARNYSWAVLSLHFYTGNYVMPVSKAKRQLVVHCNCYRHNFTRTVRTTVRAIRDILDNMQEDQFIWQPYDMDSDRIMAYAADFTPELWRSPVKLVRAQIGAYNTYSTSEDGKDDAEQIQALRLSNQPRPTDFEGLSRLLDRYDATLDNICQFVMHSNQNPTNENNPSTSHRQRRSNSRISTSSAERDNIGIDIAGPSTAYTPQDYYVPQPSQQDDWFQSAPYMPSHAESYSAHVDLDLGLGVNQPYAPEYNVSPIPFPSFSAYRDPVESSSATTSSRLHINDDDDDNEQDEPTQNIVEEIRRPRRQHHRRNCGTGGHF
ncbi:UNVERIFIED_CONTAM: hypothetical protein Sradi_1757300 [Sesamum radiatum]|uniref:Aminotransferase-like plant mobile domain-containing protein n=1 Tax=Sesamum radiatum TaxID=300843 RepID=A0AAW2TUT5_SESRA